MGWLSFWLVSMAAKENVSQNPYEQIPRVKEVVTQGSVFRDIDIAEISQGMDKARKVIKAEFVIVISQACDIEQATKVGATDNAMLPNILLLPMYDFEKFLIGQHLQSNGVYTSYNIDQQNIAPLLPDGASKEKQEKRQTLIKSFINNNEKTRYHYFRDSNECGLPQLIIDFKHYYAHETKSFATKYTGNYVITLQDLYRALLSQRFCNYLARIGLPEAQNIGHNNSNLEH